MPTLIYESFYIRTLILNLTEAAVKVRPSEHSESFLLAAYEKSFNFRVPGELDTNGNVHSVWQPPDHVPRPFAMHPVRMEGCPHIMSIVIWLLPPDDGIWPNKPWHKFNSLPIMERKPKCRYPNVARTGITFPDFEHRDQCFRLLMEWCAARAMHRGILPQAHFPLEILGTWTPDQEGT